MFLRYESFREYIRFYPITTLLLGIIIITHIGFEVAALVNDVPAVILKQVYGGFLKLPEYGIVPEYWRYISSVFLHGDFLHLLFNAFTLFVFAPPLERAIGRGRYFSLFIFSGIMGNIFTNFYPGSVISVGASGAVYGVFGAYMYYMIFQRRVLDPQTKKTLQTILVIGVVYSIIMPQINFYAHLGGFLGGLVLNLLYSKLLQGRSL